MADDNFWLILERLANKLRADQRNQLDVRMDHILEELAAYKPAQRNDMRETLAVVIARLAILQVRLPPNN